MKSVRSVAAFVIIWTVGAGVASAQSLGGSIQASLVLESACTIVGSDLMSGADFGALAFGTRPATFSGEVTAQATGGAGVAGQTRVICSADVDAISVAVDGGENAGEGTTIGSGARAMGDGASSFVPYDVFADAGLTSAYPVNGTSLPFTVPSAGQPFDVPLYGRVNKFVGTAVAAGTYTDTLLVTITF